MSKKYMSRPPYGFNEIPDFTTPPMTVEEYKACEAKYFDFLKPEEAEIEQPVGAFSRLLRFIGMSKSTTINGDDAAVQESSNKSQGGGDKEETVTESRESSDEDDHTTITDLAEAKIDVNSNIASYKLKEEPSGQTKDVHVVSSSDCDKEFNSCRLQFLEEPHANDTIIDGDKEKPTKSSWKSLRKFFLRPFGMCLRTEE